MDQHELRLKLGQRLSVGFDGFEIPEEYIRLVREYKIGNVILFRRNVQSRNQLKKICGDLRRLINEETGQDPFIMIDEECGSVSRISHIAAMTPSAMAIGATDDPENARAVAHLIGNELRALGINFNLAPVLDCFTNRGNTVCGNRCFSNDPNKVAQFGVAYINGLHEAGIIACGKHFPGHGDTDVDSHLALPTVNKTMEEMRNMELVPFKAAIDAGIDSIMSAHIIFPCIEPDMPGTVSKKVLTGLLRDEMGFKGLIVSDGMEMKAVNDLYGIADGTLRALKAGVDIALICHSAEEAAKTMLHLEEAYRSGNMTEAEINEHYAQICNYKEKLASDDFDFDDLVSSDQIVEAERIMEQAITPIHVPVGKTWPAVDKNTVVFGTRARRNAIVNDDIELNAAKSFADAFGCIYSDGTPSNAPEQAIVFIGRHPETNITVDGAKRLLDKGTQLIAVSLFTPSFLDPLPDSVWKIAAWQYDDLSIAALVGFFKKLGKG